jgi:predicted small lipoprotein YifL
MIVISRRTLVIALAGAALAGCGRRGPLEPPPDSAQGREFARRRAQSPGQPRGSVAAAVENRQPEPGSVDVEGQIEGRRAEGEPASPADPGSIAPQVTPTGGRRRPPGIVPPKRDFLLDPLLD